MSSINIQQLTAQAKMPVTTLKQLEEATRLLSDLNRHLDAITADKEKLTKPLNASLKAIRDKYRPQETLLTEAISTIRNNLTAYHKQQQAAQKAQEDKILADNRTTASTKITKLSQLAPVYDKINTASGSVSFRTITAYRLKDPAKCPTELLILNTTLLKQYIKDDPNYTIPEGIEQYEEQSLVNRRG